MSEYALDPSVTAALQAAQQMPVAEPVPAVDYVSHGRLLILGSLEQALPWARLLADTLQVEVLSPDLSSLSHPGFKLQHGALTALQGWLGAFDAAWPQGGGRYDLVLDLHAEPWFAMHLPPQGYFRLTEDPLSAARVAKELVQAVGEFEKPKYFAYEEKLCAHSRSRLSGCNQCLDVCSTQAIRSAGDKVVVEPHLCMGCGACASVCPSGAMRYNYPSVAYTGEKIRVMLAAYTAHGGSRPALLFYNEAAAHEILEQEWVGAERALVRAVVPFAVEQVPSIGLDLLLYAIAAGAERVLVAMPAHEAPQYLAAMQAQMALAETLLHGLGYHGEHFALFQPGQLAQTLARLADAAPALRPAEVAAFKPFNEKRTTLEFCLNYFVKHAEAVPEQIALPAGAPFGNVLVDQAACTLCMSCVSACPAAALRDTPGQPMLKFVERNCVQCGLCEQTCPEDAIRLAPRLLLTSEVTQARTLNEDAPFHCVSCGKVFGTTRMVQSMTAKLAGHSMFATPQAQRRLQMCGDCRVIDMMAPQAAPAKETQP